MKIPRFEVGSLSKEGGGATVGLQLKLHLVTPAAPTIAERHEVRFPGSPQPRELVAQAFERGAEVRDALLLLLDDGRRRLGDEGLVRELAARLGDLALDAGDLLGKACLLGSHVDFHVQAQAGLADNGHGRGLCGGGPGGFVVEHLDFAELGQCLQ